SKDVPSATSEALCRWRESVKGLQRPQSGVPLIFESSSFTRDPQWGPETTMAMGATRGGLSRDISMMQKSHGRRLRTLSTTVPVPKCPEVTNALQHDHCKVMPHISRPLLPCSPALIASTVGTEGEGLGESCGLEGNSSSTGLSMSDSPSSSKVSSNWNFSPVDVIPPPPIAPIPSRLPLSSGVEQFEANGQVVVLQNRGIVSAHIHTTKAIRTDNLTPALCIIHDSWGVNESIPPKITGNLPECTKTATPPQQQADGAASMWQLCTAQASCHGLQLCRAESTAASLCSPALPDSCVNTEIGLLPESPSLSPSLARSLSLPAGSSPCAGQSEQFDDRGWVWRRNEIGW
ncbi:hypothetical protein DNTS_033935, partial [Danionella cerebrum]